MVATRASRSGYTQHNTQREFIMTKERDYTITTWADGFGVWHARADFPYGCGNTGDGERLLANARRCVPFSGPRTPQTRPDGAGLGVSSLYDTLEGLSDGTGAPARNPLVATGPARKHRAQCAQ